MKKHYFTLYFLLIFGSVYSQNFTIQNNIESVLISPNGLKTNRSTTTGKNNISIGLDALKAATTATKSVAIGDSAMLKTTDGGQSVAIGINAMRENTIGGYNVAIGNDAMRNNIAGYANVAVGNEALYANNGLFNTSIGNSSMNKNTMGGSNTAIGNSTLFSNTTSSSNIAIGNNALNNQSFSNGGTNYDSNNIAIGVDALKINNPTNSLNGNNNIAIGRSSLQSNTFGKQNISIGFEAQKSTTAGFGNISIGTQALSYNVGGVGNVAVGNFSMPYSDNTSETTSIGNSSGFMAVNCHRCTFLGSRADLDAMTPNATFFENSTTIGYNAKVFTSNKVVIGNANVITIGGYASWSNYSDKRLKENILYTDKLGLEFISKLNTASYNYIKDENKRRRDGLIAQDVKQILKELGLEFSGLIEDNDPQKTLNLSYIEFIMPLINAVKELNAKNKDLQSKIDKLANLQARIEALESEK